jgi:hypothetical protein
MLEGLPAIDWESLTHAYGPAGDVPDMIRALTSQDPEQWVGALDGLYATLCHQTCTVYPATAAAVPFLLELLGYREIRCRGRILQFLGDAARATSYLAAHGDLSHYDKERETEEFQEKLAEELDWVRETRERIWNGLDLYLDLLSDLDKRLRIVVPYTLGLLVAYASGQMPESVSRRQPYRLMTEPMSRQLRDEPNELVRASLVFGLGSVAPHEPTIAPLLERLLTDRSVGRVVKLSAALCMAGLDTEPSPAVLDVLLEALNNRNETDHLFDSDQPDMEGKHHPLAKAYREAGSPLGDTAGVGYDPDDVGQDEDFKFPWLDGWPTVLVLNRLSRAGGQSLDRVIPLLTPYLDQANPYTAEGVSRPILWLVFGDRKVTAETTRADLTPEQRDVLQHLYDNPHLWATDIANATSAFGEFGLPSKRKAFGKLLGIEDEELTDEEIKAVLTRIAPAQQFSSRGPQIRRLNLREIGTPAFLPHLKEYADLEELDLSGIPLMDCDLQYLLPLPMLKKLHIPGAKITDGGVEVLIQLRNLRELNVSGTRLTDRGLEALQRLEKLYSLWLWKVPLSDEAVRRFQEARSKCKISR